MVSEMKKIEDHIQAKEGEIQKYERFVNEVSGHLAKEMEVIRLIYHFNVTAG